MEIVKYAQECSRDAYPDEQPPHLSEEELVETVYQIYEQSLTRKEAANFLSHLKSCPSCFEHLETVFDETFRPATELVENELEDYAGISLAKIVLTENPPISREKDLQFENNKLTIRQKIAESIDKWIPPIRILAPVTMILIAGFFVGKGPFMTWRAGSYTADGMKLLQENWTITDEDLRPAGLFPRSMFSSVHSNGSEDEEAAVQFKFEKALSWDEENVEAKHGLAMFWYFTGQLTPADSLLNTLLAHDSLDYQAWNILGLVETKNENENNALHAFETALKIKPDYAEAAYNRALLLQQMGLLPEAKEAWQHYLTIDQESDWAKSVRLHIENLQSVN
ncbi:MAG: tetratricopeptide repeat protein [bacterium]